MRRALAILLVAVLAFAPCSSMGVSQLLASHHSTSIDLLEVASGHSEVGDNHSHDRTADRNGDQHHNGSSDCLIACDQGIAQVGASDGHLKVVAARTSISVAYIALLASDDRYAVPKSGNGTAHMQFLRTTVDSMTILDRTTRLRI
ncbi:MAG: hypothetical protein ACI89J_004611 [Hyphomicrobiaceae bacterium]|jgi:hypothetical protein